MKNFCLHPGTLLYMDRTIHVGYGLKNISHGNIKNLENRFYYRQDSMQKATPKILCKSIEVAQVI